MEGGKIRDIRHRISSAVRPKSQGLNFAIIIIGLIVLFAMLPVTVLHFTGHVKVDTETLGVGEKMWIPEGVAILSILFGLALVGFGTRWYMVNRSINKEAMRDDTRQAFLKNHPSYNAPIAPGDIELSQEQKIKAWQNIPEPIAGVRDEYDLSRPPKPLEPPPSIVYSELP